MIVTRTVHIADPLARANVVEALGGAGAPIGVVEVTHDGPAVTIRFDEALTPSDLIDDLVAIESVLVPEWTPGDLEWEDAAAIAAAGLGDPDLTAGRILEAHLGTRT